MAKVSVTVKLNDGHDSAFLHNWIKTMLMENECLVWRIPMHESWSVKETLHTLIAMKLDRSLGEFPGRAASQISVVKIFPQFGHKVGRRVSV